MTKFTVAISPFARSERSGHSLTDDEFYFKYLLERGKEFIFYTSEFSAKQIAEKYPTGMNHLRIVAAYQEQWLGHILFARQLKIPNNAKVIFFGYTERLVLAWFLINLFKPFELVLVATNNISIRRVELYRKQIKFFLSIVNFKLHRIVLHTQYEARLLNSVASSVAAKCFVKRHHLMIPKQRAKNSRGNSQITLSYFGPHKAEKPLSPLIDLIKADQDAKFKYQIFNVGSDEILRLLGQANMPCNVTVQDEWKSEVEYGVQVNSSDLIVMTHNRDFEGKLSGNLCDCVAYGVPYIASTIEPLISIEALYGEVGILCDFAGSNWEEGCLAQINRKNLDRMSENIKKMAFDHTYDVIVSDLDRALKYE